MSHSLPPFAHPARELFEVADLVAVATGEREPVIDLWRAKRLARDTFAASPAARRVAYIVLRADNDELQLITVGRRGGHRVEWRFGPWRPRLPS